MRYHERMHVFGSRGLAVSTFRLLIFLFFPILQANPQVGWQTYGGDPGGQRYSSSRQITPSNIGNLRVVWTYHTHALDKFRTGRPAASFEATPVLYNGTLYFATPFDEVIALDAATGAEQWKFDPQLTLMGDGNLTTSRGVAIWTGKDSGPCASRVLLGTLDARLLAIDALTGRPCIGFGADGQVDLTKDVGYQATLPYEVTSAPTVVGDVVVVGSSIPDNQAVNVAHGTVRGFDVRTGKQLWAWDPIASWADRQKLRTGAANSWSTISADPALGLIYIPTGSASPDHFGAMRPGDNRDADSVVALEARTGKRVWGFQVVHHNLWDYDVAAEPLLFTWHAKIPAVAIGTKMGQIFVLDRRTGVPLFPVVERPVPRSDVPGEEAWPTQPFSSLPPVNPTDLNEAGLMYHRSPANADYCAKQMAGKRYDGIYTPPSLRGSLEYPGPIGGVNWGSLAFDPYSQILYANNNSDVYEVELIPRKQMAEKNPGSFFLRARVVRVDSAIGHTRIVLCLAGLFLVLGWVVARRPVPDWRCALIAVLLLTLVPLHWMMELQAYRDQGFLARGAINASRDDDYSPQLGTPYWMHRRPIVDHDGRPCAKAPWGALTAINLMTGKQVFRVAHGTEMPGQQTGSLNVSGPIVTAGGLVFSAGTREPILHAYNAATGAEVWQAQMPVPAQATPMSYEIKGTQYVVIADGGHGVFGTAQGDSVIAYALK